MVNCVDCMVVVFNVMLEILVDCECVLKEVNVVFEVCVVECMVELVDSEMMLCVILEYVNDVFV